MALTGGFFEMGAPEGLSDGFGDGAGESEGLAVGDEGEIGPGVRG